MKQIAAMIIEVLKNMDDTQVLEKVKTQVAEMCSTYPLYQ